MSSLKKINIQQLSKTARIDLAEELWDSIAEEQDDISVTDVQKNIIEERFAKYQASPTEGYNWEDIKNEMK